MPPLKVRRRGHGPVKSRIGLRPREILSNAAPTSPPWISYGKDDFPAIASNPPALGVFQLGFGSSSNFDLSLGMFQYPLPPFDQVPNADDFMAVGNQFSTQHDSSFGNEHSSSADSHAESHHGCIDIVASGMNMLDLAGTARPLPGLLAQLPLFPQPWTSHHRSNSLHATIRILCH